MANFLIIAASSTIGQSTCDLLKRENHNLYTTSRSETKIIPDMILDATDFEAVDQAFLNAKQKFGQIDGVVNFSGSLLLRAAHLTSKDQYQEVINSSLTTSFAIARAAGRHMDKGGSVVFIASAAASIGLVNHESISAAKAGVIGLALSASATYADKNLRFNVVAPGLVATNLTKNITASQQSLEYSTSMHSLGRIGKPEDIARAVVFLLDPKNDWITGQVLNVDGGLSSSKTRIRSK